MRMSSAVERLTSLQPDEGRYAIPYADLKRLQIEAINERFADRRDKIKLLGHRAEEASITEVRSLGDAVPLLFPHTAYKSYPESWLLEERWNRLTKWLGTISPYPIAELDYNGIVDIDDWVDRLQAKQHYISCSSGTTGKNAMLIASERDMDWTRVETVNGFAWGSGVQPAQDRMMIGCAPTARVPKNVITGEAQRAAYANPEWGSVEYPAPAITIGALTRAVVMRKAIADGTALPGDIASFEETSKARAAAMEAAIGITAETLVKNRDRKLLIAGMWNTLYQIAKAVRELGFSAKDFDSDNLIYVGGGLKRAQLPPDYQEFVHETFNIPEGRHFQNYSMQELNSGMPKCRECGRYHVPPWVVPMILNKAGDALEPTDYNGEVEGRAAFFDLSLDGRWGGVITGDKITVDYSGSRCSQRGPSVADNIARFADLEGDDKIGCAGTVDAYVRGVS
jgi:hypothetical protein